MTITIVPPDRKDYESEQDWTAAMRSHNFTIGQKAKRQQRWIILGAVVLVGAGAYYLYTR